MTEFQKNKKMSECSRNGNTGGRRLRKQSKKALEATRYNVLRDLESKNRRTRILLDLLTVSITPKISKKGWKMIKNTSEEDIKEYGLYNYKPMGKLKELTHDEFYDYFIKTFDNFFNFKEDVEENRGGGRDGGYNYGRVYKLGDTTAKAVFQSFSPEYALKYQGKDDSDYVLGSRHRQFIHQKVRLDLSGDAIQYLRQNGKLLEFIIKLHKTFPVSVTMFDIAMDYFNYGLEPAYFADLYRKDYYTGLSKVNGNGDFKEPTVYIGAYKGNETVMLYDKILESKDMNKSDEPELLDVLNRTGGDWFRLEQHYSNDGKSAREAFGFIIYNILCEYNTSDNLEDRFIELMSSMLYKRLTAPKKPRFLSKKRMKRNNTRIPTDKKWEMILNEIDKVEIDFAYMRPELTLEERMNNFKYKSIGGKNLFYDIIDELGEKAYIEFMNDVAMYHIELKRREDSEN